MNDQHSWIDQHTWTDQNTWTDQHTRNDQHACDDPPVRNDQSALRYLPPGSIIPAADLETVQVAESYLAWSQDCLKSAQEAADTLRARAAAEGYADGVRQGRREAAAALSEVVARFRADLASLQPSLAPIVVRAVEKLVGSLDREELVQACLGAALADIAAEVEVTLFVPPQDADFFRSQIEAIGASGGSSIALAVDPLLKGGEMLLATPAGRTHIGARQQISRLAAALAPDRSS
jgi:flagellar biosynthesis/type III secretory pathway protein FliH